MTIVGRSQSGHLFFTIAGRSFLLIGPSSRSLADRISTIFFYDVYFYDLSRLLFSMIVSTIPSSFDDCFNDLFFFVRLMIGIQRSIFTIDRWPIVFSHPFSRSLADRNLTIPHYEIVGRSFFMIPFHDRWPFAFNDPFLRLIVGRSLSTIVFFYDCSPIVFYPSFFNDRWPTVFNDGFLDHRWPIGIHLSFFFTVVSSSFRPIPFYDDQSFVGQSCWAIPFIFTIVGRWESNDLFSTIVSRSFLTIFCNDRWSIGFQRSLSFLRSLADCLQRSVFTIVGRWESNDLFAARSAADICYFQRYCRWSIAFICVYPSLTIVSRSFSRYLFTTIVGQSESNDIFLRSLTDRLDRSLLIIFGRSYWTIPPIETDWTRSLGWTKIFRMGSWIMKHAISSPKTNHMLEKNIQAVDSSTLKRPIRNEAYPRNF